MEILDLVRLMSFGLFATASAILLYFLMVYVRFVLAETYRHGWWLLATAAGAGLIYGGAGFLHTYAGVGVADVFRRGASLFFILFLALGIRAIARIDTPGETGEPSSFMNYGFDFLIAGLFVLVWWTSFTLWYPGWLLVIHAVGWIVMLLFAIYFALISVRKHEGTSLAAVVRHLLPAVLCFGAVILTEILYQFTGSWGNLAEAAWIVGMVLVSAFLFNTATTIRQEEAELHRIYDPTTWREQ